MISIDINKPQRNPLYGGSSVNATEILSAVDKKIEKLKEDLGSNIPSPDAPEISEITGNETFVITDTDGNYRTIALKQISSSQETLGDFSKQFNFDFN